MSSREIDDLIGGGFIGLEEPEDWHNDVPRYDFKFLSGPQSTFIVVVDTVDEIAEARRVHREALAVKRIRQQSALVTVNVPATSKRRFLASLDKRTRDLRNFIVDEVAVFELSFSTALKEAQDVLEQITGSNVDQLNISRVQKAAEQLVELHTMNKLCKVLGVSVDIRRAVLANMGQSDGNNKNLPNMQSLLKMLAARKGPGEQVRGVEGPKKPVDQRRAVRRDGDVRPSTRSSGGR
jgi:hypothetical protein